MRRLQEFHDFCIKEYPVKFSEYTRCMEKCLDLLDDPRDATPPSPESDTNVSDRRARLQLFHAKCMNDFPEDVNLYIECLISFVAPLYAPESTISMSDPPTNGDHI